MKQHLRDVAWAVALATIGLSPTGAAPPDDASTDWRGVWESVSYGEDLQLLDVVFVSVDEGWVAGERGTILRTRDAGASWEAQLGGDPEAAARPVQDLRFVDATHGWATQLGSGAGGDGMNLLRTTDGETWERIGGIEPHYKDLLFTTRSNGFFTYNAQIFRTTDGGKSWQAVFDCKSKVLVDELPRTQRCEVFALAFATPEIGWAEAGTGDFLIIASTTDGGATWKEVWQLPETNAFHADIAFVDEHRGFLRTGRAGLFRTTDGGATWQGVAGANFPDPSQIKFADPEVGWSIGFRATGTTSSLRTLTYTVDGGRRWTSKEIPLPAGVFAFSLPRRDRAYAVGPHGMIYRYRVLPASELPAKMIPGPAMPPFSSPLDAQVDRLAARLRGLRERVQLAPAAGAQSADASYVESCCAAEFAELASSAESVALEVPRFGERFRNLNLLVVGLETVAGLTDRSRSLPDLVARMRAARDPAALAAALSTASQEVDSLVADTRIAYQRPR